MTMKAIGLSSGSLGEQIPAEYEVRPAWAESTQKTLASRQGWERVDYHV